MTTIDFQVQGMTCGSCVRHVTHALTAITGVARVDVDLSAGTARVEGNAESTTLLAAMDEAGYQAQVANNATPTAAPKTGCVSGCGCR
jgi:copper chaperone CopZ